MIKSILLGAISIFALFITSDAKAQIILDANATADDPEHGIYRDARRAIAALTDGTPDAHTTLTVRPGVYWLDDPDDPAIRKPVPGEGTTPFAVTLSASHLTIKATDPDPRKTVWAVSRGQTQGADGNFTMLKVTGTDIAMEGITFGNYCNVDLEYPDRPDLSRKRRADAIVQAQIGICQGSDKMYFKNCRFISRLNLCPFIGAKRAVYEDCHFECTDDALTGRAVYLRCHFTFFSGKPFYNTSQTGAIMLGCEIESRVEGEQYFTKAGGPLALIDTHISGPGITKLGWSKGAEVYTAYTSNVTLNGKAIDIDPWRTVNLDGTEALKAYKHQDGTYNTGGLTAGDDGWNPTGDPNPTPLATTLILKTKIYDTQSAEDSVTFEQIEKRWGGYDVLTIHKPETKVYASTSWKTQEILETRKTPSGLQASAKITLQGIKLPSPSLRRKPKLKTLKDVKRDDSWSDGDFVRESTAEGVITIDYETQATATAPPDAQADSSLVTWYRVMPTGEKIAICEGRGEKSHSYVLTSADSGCKISARLLPQTVGSEVGEPIILTTRKIWNLKKGALPYYVSPDLSALPRFHSKDSTLREVWLQDAYKPAGTKDYKWEATYSAARPAWRYGKGADGAAHTEGLITNSRGARLTYTPDLAASPDNQTVTLTLCPCKPAGQGFGSATGQYLDVMLMLDPTTGDAIGVRIERTPEYDKQVVMTIMRYSGEGAKAISESVATPNFRPTCKLFVDVSAQEGVVAILYPAQSSSPSEGTILETKGKDFGHLGTGFRLQHTGSVGANALQIIDIKMKYDKTRPGDS